MKIVLDKIKYFIKKTLKFFFAPEHLVRTFWSIVVALIFFIIGILYNSNKEPSKVFITNTPELKDTLVLRIEGNSLEPNFFLDKRMQQIANEISQLRNLYNNPQKENYNLDDIESVKSRPLETNIGSKENEITLRLKKVPLIYEPSLAPVKIPKFHLPQNVKGYSVAQFSTLGKITIQKTEFIRNEEIRFIFEIFDPKLIGKISPLIVDVLRKESENTYTLLYNQQYIIQPEQNLVMFNADFNAGKVSLQAGFYFLEDLKEEYPTFYRNQLEITIVDK
jgi:hypothetical protein